MLKENFSQSHIPGLQQQNGGEMMQILITMGVIFTGLLVIGLIALICLAYNKVTKRESAECFAIILAIIMVGMIISAVHYLVGEKLDIYKTDIMEQQREQQSQKTIQDRIQEVDSDLTTTLYHDFTYLVGEPHIVFDELNNEIHVSIDKVDTIQVVEDELVINVRGL